MLHLLKTIPLPYVATSLALSIDSDSQSFYMENQGRAEVLKFSLDAGQQIATLEKKAPALRAEALRFHGDHLLSLESGSMEARLWRNEAPLFYFDARPTPIRSAVFQEERLWMVCALPLSESLTEAGSITMNNVVCLDIANQRVRATLPFSYATMLAVAVNPFDMSVHFAGLRYLGEQQYALLHFCSHDGNEFKETQIAMINARQVPALCHFAVSEHGDALFYGESLRDTLCYRFSQGIWQTYPFVQGSRLVALRAFRSTMVALLASTDSKQEDTYLLWDVMNNKSLFHVYDAGGHPFAMAVDNNRNLLVACDQEVHYYFDEDMPLS